MHRHLSVVDIVPNPYMHADLAAAAQYAGADGKNKYKFFHGTSFKYAQKIKQGGFIKSTKGLLGEGVYVAREGKARRFATQCSPVADGNRLFGRLGPDHDQGG